MFDKIRKIFGSGRTKSATASQTTTYPFGASATMSFLSRNGSYDNNYPNITRIAERFATVMPYAVNLNGEKIETEVPVMDAIYRPNKQMSIVKFLKTLAVMELVHPTTYLLVWHREGNQIFPGGQITPQNIAGFTFLEDITNITTEKGITFYQTLNGTFTDREVMALSLDINPYAILKGYSPSVAAKRWATVDDYLVDYQAGFFKNGAVPSGQFIITCATVDEFDTIVDELQKHHRGAGKNNNAMYTHRPLDPVGGKPLNPSVEWIPFSQSNKDLSLKDIFDQAERVRDMDFGVPAEIKGYLQNSNYASATTAEHMFDKYVVKPKLVQIWSDFTHELDRITGGLGCAISFDFDLTALADEQKVFNESKRVQLDTYITALQAGFSPEATISALGLPEEFEELGEITVFPTFEIPVENSAKSVENSPKEKAVDPKENPLAAAGTNTGVEDVARNTMRQQINEVIYGEDGSITRDMLDENMARDILEALKPGIELNGVQQYSSALAALISSGFPIPDGTAYSISDSLLTRYRAYLQKVAKSYNDDTAASIRRIVEQGAVEDWTNVELADNLRGIMNTDEWRVQRLARTETHRSAGLASLDAMQELQSDSGIKFKKTWRVNPNTPNHCDYCLEMDGKSTDLDTPFITEEDNGFADMEMAAAHPNCGCYMVYEPVATPKSIDFTCPKCKRFLGKGFGTIKNLKCQKCKAHYDFTVAGGKAIASKSQSSPPAPKVKQKSCETIEPDGGTAPKNSRKENK